MNLDKELIQKMHDAYMIEYQNNLNHDQDYKQMAKDQNTWQLNLNARLYQGKWSALIHVINDLRHILELPEIGEDMNSYGYIFNVE